MSSKKVVIDIRKVCVDKSIKNKDVTEEFGVSGVSLLNWRNEAPDVVKGIKYSLNQNPGIDVLKVLKNWPKKPHVLQFVFDFMEKHNCKFTDIVVEN